MPLNIIYITLLPIMTSSKCLIVTMLFSIIAFCGRAQKITAATFNIRLQTDTDTGNLWAQRAPNVASLIRFHGFDVFATQEGFRNQLDDIKKSVPEYDYYGAGRDDGKQAGEHSAIFYRKDRFTVLKSGDFWLSETPDQPSKGWDATCCNRICSWIHLSDKLTGKSFYFFSAHFDHQGQIARIESSKLVLQRINSIAGNEPVIFAGDLNGNQQSEWHKNLENSDVLDDSYKQVNFPYANNGTFNAFGKTLASNDIIDHIFLSKHFLVRRWGILSDSYHGKFPSDHFPVLADVEFK
jgi:endonuclease/exonuclease/phosphatase family metal-dependent hydrolase